VGDLVVVYCCVAANTNDTPTCSDNNGSGTYDLIDVMNFTISSVNYRMSVFIRTALMVNTTSTVITVATGSNSSGTIHVIPITGISRTGANAVRSKGSQNNQAAATAAPALNQSALTGNGTLVVQGSADTTTTAPTNWTEVLDTSQSNDTVALESASRASGFTGTTITFGAASSTVFCSHAMELDGSALLAGSALIGGAGAIASAATFLSVFERTALVDGAGVVSTSGQRALQRSAEFNASVGITGTSTFFSVLNGAAGITANMTIAAAGESFSLFTASVLIDGVSDLTVSSEFVSVLERGSLTEVIGSIGAVGIFFSIIQSTSTTSINAVIESAGQVQAGAGDIERSASITTTGEIASGGLAILERATGIDSTSGIAVSAVFFTTVEMSITVSVTTSIDSAGHQELLRAASLSAGCDIASSSDFLSISEAGGLFIAEGSIELSGLALAPPHERLSLTNCTVVIATSGTIIQTATFTPRQTLVIGAESRRSKAGSEIRIREIDSEIQSEVL
jgi:hypothetical protein